MSSYVRGQVIRLYTEPPFRNDAGTEVDPTTVTVRVTDPAAVTTDYTLAAAQVVKTTTGQGRARATAYANGDFYYDLATAGLADTKIGEWVYTWIGTGAVAPAARGTFVLLNEKKAT